MTETKLSQILELREKSIGELQGKYAELFPGQQTPSNNKVYLWRKIAYRLQELEYGGISVEAQNKIQQLIQQFDPINNKTLRPDDALKERPKKTKLSRDKRLPIPGTVIIKEYKGIKLEVKILESGFEFRSKVYKSLTAIAKEITGAHWNGYLFFNL
ncbi:hypothetical protein BU251_07510 [Candidatus Velamenicoccus archaeovorus]|uniref:DUF2924 domain-containing protein n=1 Tax=Velamenicoccus archaeovorus TaxID=1930593 RepID=A0A410P6J9_VELA1|nr:DUF2924 domain-containing protein [Candidatus Velamenicoccus archaeovorus]QAT17574.1 hypothetical protein BU251_07510 [Candidatus Velamenicoccus archaeovorus]